MVQLRFTNNQTSIRVGQPPEVQPRTNPITPAPVYTPAPAPAPATTRVNIKINHHPVHSAGPEPVEPAVNLPGVSIIVCTNRPEFMERVIANYTRQAYLEKELIVVLNNNAMNPDHWHSHTAGYSNIHIFQVDESRSLGECLNTGIDHCAYDYVAKFDDDDYYGPNYLTHQMRAMLDNNADVVGKATWYLYFERSNTLALFCRHPENSFVNYVTGATLLIKKEVFNGIRFSAMTVGEDVDFVAVCKEHGLRIYSTDKADFVGIRRALISSHTWQESDEHILAQCQVVANTDNYIRWANQ